MDKNSKLSELKKELNKKLPVKKTNLDVPARRQRAEAIQEAKKIALSDTEKKKKWVVDSLNKSLVPVTGNNCRGRVMS